MQRRNVAGRKERNKEGKKEGKKRSKRKRKGEEIWVTGEEGLRRR